MVDRGAAGVEAGAVVVDPRAGAGGGKDKGETSGGIITVMCARTGQEINQTLETTRGFVGVTKLCAVWRGDDGETPC